MTNAAPDPRKPAAYEPDMTLKNLLGGEAGLAHIFSPAIIRRCQHVLDEAHGNFFEHALDAAEHLRQVLKNEEKHSGFALLAAVSHAAVSLQEQAEALNYRFVASVCEHIVEVCECAEQVTAGYLSLLHQLVDMLHLSIKHRIEDEGGELGRDLSATMEQVLLRAYDINAERPRA